MLTMRSMMERHGSCNVTGRLWAALRLFGDGEPVLDNTPQRVHAIAPPNLFAFFIGSPAVGDPYFIHPPPVPRHFDGEFWLTAESVLLQREPLEDLTAKGLRSRLHIGQVDVSDGITQQREHRVADPMPKIQDPAFCRGEKARAIHHIRLPRQEWAEELDIIRRIILQIRVLEEEQVARCRSNARA
jgi:hypothetical protein